MLRKELFGNENASIRADFPSNINAFVSLLPTGHCLNQDVIINEHSILPLYMPFTYQSRYEIMYQLICKRGLSNFACNLINNKKGVSGFLRLCLECVKEDRGKWGEAYWHRVHQVHGVYICPIHSSPLCLSNILLRNKFDAYRLFTAEMALSNSDFKNNFIPEDCFDIFKKLSKDVHWIIRQRKLSNVFDTVMKYHSALGIERLIRHKRFTSKNIYPGVLLEYIPKNILSSLGYDDELEKYKLHFLRFLCLHIDDYGFFDPILHLIIISFLGYTAEEFFE